MGCRLDDGDLKQTVIVAFGAEDEDMKLQGIQSTWSIAYKASSLYVDGQKTAQLIPSESWINDKFDKFGWYRFHTSFW